MAPIELYSMATPNGQKVGIMLEELGVPYEAHLVDISKGEQFKPEFVKVSPNSKIPALVDPQGPDGKPLTLFESGAILLYLAEKYDKLLPKDAAKKWACLQWVFFQAGGIGPMMGQLGHFSGVPKEKLDSTYPYERYLTEVKRLFKVVDTQLAGQEYIVGEYSIADIMLCSWMNGGRTRLSGKLNMAEDYPNVLAWLERVYDRPAVQKGITVCAKS